MHKLLAQATVGPGFVHPCLRIVMRLLSVFKATQSINFVIYVTLFNTHTQLVSLLNVILFPGVDDYEV